METKNIKVSEVVIEGITYVPKGSEKVHAECVDGMPFVLIRGYASGVQYGYMKSRNGCEVELLNSRRIWKWDGATETNQIAVCGINKNNSNVTMIIPYKIITDAIEIEYITKNAEQNLINQDIWKK